MVQKVSLHGSLRPGNVRITLHTLTSLTGMDPAELADHCTVWVPNQEYRPPSGSGTAEQYRVNLVRPQQGFPLVPYKSTTARPSQDGWSLVVKEVPDAGKRKATIQAFFKTGIEAGDPFQFLEALGYTFSFEYWIKGYYFVHGTLVIKIFRLHAVQEFETNPSLVLLDPSGQYTIEVSGNVEHVTDVEGLDMIVGELERFKTEVAGLFDLTMVERSSLDGRVR